MNKPYLFLHNEVFYIFVQIICFFFINELLKLCKNDVIIFETIFFNIIYILTQRVEPSSNLNKHFGYFKPVLLPRPAQILRFSFIFYQFKINSNFYNYLLFQDATLLNNIFLFVLKHFYIAFIIYSFNFQIFS